MIGLFVFFICSIVSVSAQTETVDNSEKILECKQQIRKLKRSMKECSTCRGTGTVKQNCYMCAGFGMTGYGQYRHICLSCNGSGKKETACINCSRTELAIVFVKKLLQGYEETHGHTKEAADAYYNHKNWEVQSERNYQKAIDDIADSYLNESNSSRNSTNSSSKCSICHGTGVDPFPWEDAASNAGQGLPWCYTNKSGKKCPYCKKYTWHQHHRCPKCNVR